MSYQTDPFIDHTDFDCHKAKDQLLTDTQSM